MGATKCVLTSLPSVVAHSLHLLFNSDINEVLKDRLPEVPDHFDMYLSLPSVQIGDPIFCVSATDPFVDTRLYLFSAYLDQIPAIKPDFEKFPTSYQHGLLTYFLVNLPPELDFEFCYTNLMTKKRPLAIAILKNQTENLISFCLKYFFFIHKSGFFNYSIELLSHISPSAQMGDSQYFNPFMVLMNTIFNSPLPVKTPYSALSALSRSTRLQKLHPPTLIEDSLKNWLNCSANLHQPTHYQ
jgi:hypothetical protein